MAGTTGAPWNIAFPTVGDNVGPLESKFAAQASTLHTALDTVYGRLGRLTMTDAQRIALVAPIRREGLLVYCTDTNYEWLYDGSNWKLQNTPVVNLTSISSGWSALAAPNNPRIYAHGGIAFVQGDVQGSGSINLASILTVPTEFRPTASGITRLGMAMGPTSNAFIYGLGINSTGVLSVERASGPSIVEGRSMALNVFWRI